MGRNYPEALHCSRGLLVSRRHSILDQFQELLFPSVTTQTQQGRWEGVKERKKSNNTTWVVLTADPDNPKTKTDMTFALKAASPPLNHRGTSYNGER